MIYTQYMEPEPQRPFIPPPISAAAPGTLYQQIVDGIKREIAEGRLVPGQALPSFRALAEELLVSVITVKRAYEVLERQGIIYRRQGLGTFVSQEGAIRNRAAKRERVEALLSEALREASEAGMSGGEIAALMERLRRQHARLGEAKRAGG